ncbi:MAG: Phosphatidylserine synthase PssA [Candidatus Methanohalarchaeum thermophilum]|uniref:Phosphatidylserine synthase PssA n=1 Tax=Methanohalarchaeum thermophilum TaxID=1903181 RepID=A0A1Q6DW53_METT1|nr:MAG: Phosphatidylserine synthase PssA [Candidatus Methanohalarchaeum thermophilum]
MYREIALPDIASLLNLTSGFIAITFLTRENYILAAKFILLSGIFDGIDGLIARKISNRKEAKFGIELDSMADLVSFGVVTALFGWKITKNNYFLLISSIFLIAAILRLARFNTKNPNEKGFKGLPTTSAGLLLSIYLVLFSNTINTILTTTLFLILSTLMVSKIKYPKFDDRVSWPLGILMAFPVFLTGNYFGIFMSIILGLLTGYIIIGPFFASSKIIENLNHIT